MRNENAVLMELLLGEKREVEESLRVLDSSLHRLAFAYIAAFALCVPALMQGAVNFSAIEEKGHLIGVVLCTLVFIGSFYAAMLIRSRNISVAHIAFLSDRVNDIVAGSYGEKKKILFQQSKEISTFYFGSGNGKVWFLTYMAFFVFFAAFYGWVVATSCTKGEWYFAILVAMEAICSIAFFVVTLKCDGIKVVQKRIASDYEKWLHCENTV